MKRVVVTVLLAACNGDVSSGTDGGGGGGDGSMGTADAPGGIGEPANLMGITLYHNQVRAAVQTTTPLPAMQWDPDLAAYAAAWAAMCKDGGDGVNGLIDHNPARQNVAGYSYIGENIFGAGGTATAMGAVNSWASEKANFTYPNGCNGVCGHYTQIVWRTSVNLGCALQNCPSLQYGSTIVCDYGPGGNSGGAPY
ncbi:MAG TPA: CAP domain-containing protein [Kofleriaceae bacterium]